MSCSCEFCDPTDDPIDAYVGGDEDEDSPALEVVEVVEITLGSDPAMAKYWYGVDQMGVAESNPLIPEMAPMEAPPAPPLPEATAPCFDYCSCEYCNYLEDEKKEECGMGVDNGCATGRSTKEDPVKTRGFRESSRTKHMEYRILNFRDEIVAEFNDAQKAYSELDRMTGELHTLGVFDMDPWMQDRTINVVTETNGWDVPEYAFIVQLASDSDDEDEDPDGCGAGEDCYICNGDKR